ncbi:hypothetical protein MB02_11625 [Croceicoccus estronivorus]|uniref:TetR/AcrR family transcriptional regulator n=1 Tax=Croceicoccus estronivorus TaxID=1172626 RepID=UPI00082B6E4E|nr:TetR family transcriptional regulator C-terminal domain-containing protein [Croceicoccus estronivorus]OCC23285.1 hypothetical protein MB02_11625 [Croceicoccus estronivorus]
MSEELDDRHSQIVDAFIRVALGDGLASTTMRRVAGEAGVSLRLVQYYFGNRSGLVASALERLEHQSRERWAHRMEASGSCGSLAETLATLCNEALPDSEESRAFHRLWTAFALEAERDPASFAAAVRDGPCRLEDEVTAMLEKRLMGKSRRKAFDSRSAARELLALVNGLSNGIMVRLYEPAAARAILRNHIARLLKEPGCP